MQPADHGHRSFRDAGGEGTIVFDPARLQQAGPELFDPVAYGAQAQAVAGQGGRGAAWYVRGPFGDGVLRHYLRGGWMARLGRQGYLWRGEGSVRSVGEFDLLQALHRAGLPVPAPIAAWYQRRGSSYRAAIIVERIPGARSFASLVDADGAGAPWRETGSAIGRCHRHRAHHADLNANNVLIDARNVAVLIDWDKGCVERAAGPWRQRVLARLRRSLTKECIGRSASELDQGMDSLRDAHDQALAS